MPVGLESISMYTSNYYLDMASLAQARGVDKDKFYIGIGQKRMAVPPPDEDIVTLAANAAYQALENVDKDQIDTLLFATESGIDQSKAAGVYVHRLLNLSKNCRVFELKQACYSGAGGLQLSLPYIIHHSDRKVLIVAADIARYGLNSVGEPTQGAGAVAMVLSATPRIMTFEIDSGLYTSDIMDFWRPNYSDEAFVDGKYSVKMYLKALKEAWNQYTALTKNRCEDFYRFAYHLPFSKMAEKAHDFLVKYCSHEAVSQKEMFEQIEEGTIYQKIIGNTYAASVFLALISLLDHSKKDLSDKRIGLFSYGSGCVGEFFAGRVQNGYKNFLTSKLHKMQLENREELEYKRYEEFYLYKSQLPTDGSIVKTPEHKTGLFRFAGIKEHQRIYEKVR